MRLYLIANLTKPETHAALPRVVSAATRLGMDLTADAATGQAAGLDPAAWVEASACKADAVLVLGGDGSVLRAVRSLGDADLPIVGINTGTLGYMACADVSRIDETLQALQEGRLVEESRRRIEGRISTPDGGEAVCVGPALNEIVVTRGDTGRIISLDLTIDGVPVTSYLCDGLVVATPTGSTAYSLSAGGPILSPRTHAVVVSVICPHSLSSRPLVLPDTAVLEVRVRRAVVEPLVSADGRDGVSLPMDGVLRISPSARAVRLLRFPDRDEFSVLRQKLGWSGSML